MNIFLLWHLFITLIKPTLSAQNQRLPHQSTLTSQHHCNSIPCSLWASILFKHKNFGNFNVTQIIQQTFAQKQDNISEVINKVALFFHASHYVLGQGTFPFSKPYHQTFHTLSQLTGINRNVERLSHKCVSPTTLEVFPLFFFMDPMDPTPYDWLSISIVIEEAILLHGTDNVVEIFNEYVSIRFASIKFDFESAVNCLLEEYFDELRLETHRNIQQIAYIINERRAHGFLFYHNLFRYGIIACYGNGENMQLEVVQYFISSGNFNNTHHSMIHVGFRDHQSSIHVLLERFISGHQCCHQFVGHNSFERYMANRGKKSGPYTCIAEKTHFANNTNYESVFAQHIEVINKEWEYKDYLETGIKLQLTVDEDLEKYVVDWHNSAGCHLYAVQLYEHICGDDVRNTVADQIKDALILRKKDLQSI